MAIIESIGEEIITNELPNSKIGRHPRIMKGITKRFKIRFFTFV